MSAKNSFATKLITLEDCASCLKSRVIPKKNTKIISKGWPLKRYAKVNPANHRCVRALLETVRDKVKLTSTKATKMERCRYITPLLISRNTLKFRIN